MIKPSSGSVLGKDSSACLPIFAFLILLFISSLLTGCGGGNVGPNNGSSLSITPSTIDFGTSLSGQNAAARPVAVTNVGLSKVTIEQVSISQPSVFHLQDWGGPVTLAPGQSFNLRLIFAPIIPGNYAALLTFLSSAARPIEPMSVSVSSSGSGFGNSLKSSAPSGPVRSITNISLFAKANAAGQGGGGSVGNGGGNGGGGGQSGGGGQGGGGAPLSISPTSADLQAGQTVQFTSNQSVTWNAVLGTITSSGLYKAPQLATKSMDTVAAVAVNDSSHYATASVIIEASNSGPSSGGGGSYSIENPPDPIWFPFAESGSVTNKPLPADILQHCWGNTSDCAAGDAIAKWTLTSGYGATNLSRNGMTVGYVYFPNTLTNGNSADISGPMYYGQANDPWYKVAGCLYDNNVNVRFHAPNQAKFAALPGGDQGIDIYDVAQGLLIQVYGYNSNPGMVMPDASNCPGSGPSSCAVTVPNVSGCSAQQAGVDTDLQGHGYRTANIDGNTYTLGGTGATGMFSGWAGMLRQNELMNGTVNHALLLGVVCGKPGTSAGQSDFVWPAQSGLLKCTNDNPGEPKAGALLFCDYTPTQISSMLNTGQISQPQATLLRTFCTYGGYVAQTGGPASGSSWQGMRLAASQAYEGQTAYQLYYKKDTGFESWACAHGMNDFGQGGCSGGTLTSPYGPNLDVLGGIPRMTGPGGHDTSGHSCSLAPGCDITGHIHVADPCVAQGLAGISGGCQ